MTVPSEQGPAPPSGLRSRRLVMFGTLPFVAVAMFVGVIILKHQPDLASSIASGVLPKIGWPFGDYHASQIALAGRTTAELDLYVASIALYGLLWQGWIALLLVTAVLSGRDAILSKHVLIIVAGIALLGLLLTVLPLAAEGQRRAGYTDAIETLLLFAGREMSIFYVCAAVLLDSLIIWLMAHRRI